MLFHKCHNLNIFYHVLNTSQKIWLYTKMSTKWEQIVLNIAYTKWVQNKNKTDTKQVQIEHKSSTNWVQYQQNAYKTSIKNEYKMDTIPTNTYKTSTKNEHKTKKIITANWVQYQIIWKTTLIFYFSLNYEYKTSISPTYDYKKSTKISTRQKS